MAAAQGHPALDLLSRVIVAPFETAVSALLVFSGVVIITHTGPPDPVNILLPSWEVYVLAVMFLLSGACTFGGLALGAIAVEGSGLLLLSGSLIIRLILYAIYLGTDVTFALSGIVDALFIAAALARLLTIRSRRVIIEIGKAGDTS